MDADAQQLYRLSNVLCLLGLMRCGALYVRRDILSNLRAIRRQFIEQPEKSAYGKLSDRSGSKRKETHPQLAIACWTEGLFVVIAFQKMVRLRTIIVAVRPCRNAKICGKFCVTLGHLW